MAKSKDKKKPKQNASNEEGDLAEVLRQIEELRSELTRQEARLTEMFHRIESEALKAESNRSTRSSTGKVETASAPTATSAEAHEHPQAKPPPASKSRTTARRRIAKPAGEPASDQ